MSTTQLSFSLRVSSGVKAVHLLGSWDSYNGQLPLSKDKTSSKSGSWKGTFRFQNATLEPGQRYWYYYIIDGYHVAHNPSVSSTVEPTTGRELNILDVPSRSSSKTSSKKSSSSSPSSSSSSSRSSRSSSSSSSSKSSSKSSSRHSSKEKESSKSSSRSRDSRGSLTLDIPKGRPLSVSQIQAPKPMSPLATQHILNVDGYDDDEIEELTARFGSADFNDDDVTEFSNSPVSSSGSSLSYRFGSASPNSSMSGYSSPNSDYSSCTCERYGITRKGERIKLDCGGSRCAHSDQSSDCSSIISESDEEEPVSSGRGRRNGIVVT